MLQGLGFAPPQNPVEMSCACFCAYKHDSRSVSRLNSCLFLLDIFFHDDDNDGDWYIGRSVLNA